jgi:NAD(P)-dependent dehydrogenase (short-subunit alcohol dehydrogenase family)
MTEPAKARVVVVTGASGGLGSVMAERFGAGGDTVFAGYHHGVEKADALVQRLTGEGYDVRPLELALGSGESVANAMARVVEDAGPVDVLINNAAYRPIGAFLDLSDDDWNEVISVNLLGTVRTSRAVLPAMAERGHGRIINISGLDALHGGFERSHVATAKAALSGLARSLALEFSRFGVTINTVIPGSFRVWRDPKLYPNWEDLRQYLVSHTPVRRQGEPTELAELCWFLASSAAGYITGQDIHINGGLYPMLANPFLENKGE